MKNNGDDELLKAFNNMPSSKLIKDFNILPSTQLAKAMDVMNGSAISKVMDVMDGSAISKVMDVMNGSAISKVMDVMDGSAISKVMDVMNGSAISKVMDSAQFNVYEKLEKSYALEIHKILLNHDLAFSEEVFVKIYHEVAIPQFEHINNQLNSSNIDNATAYEKAMGLMFYTLQKFLDGLSLTAKETFNTANFLTVMCTLICLFQAKYLSDQTEEQIQSVASTVTTSCRTEINTLEKTIKTINERNLQEKPGIFYVVVRTAQLYKSPGKQKIDALLHPNERVRLVKSNVNWIKIEYFDHLEDIYKSGWVLKDHLVILGSEQPSKEK